MFPRVPDQHKPGKPLVPNGLGIIYVLTSTVYLFLLHFFGAEGIALIHLDHITRENALALAGCILFGGFLGLLDDWMDLRWRYKAVLPLLAALPLAALQRGDTCMATYFFGKVDFGVYYYILIIPLIVTITTNVVNQLGGLNGLETICPSIVMIGLMITSPEQILLYLPLATYLLLAVFNFQGKIFVGNTGTFAVGITLASYAIIANIEQTLFISILPYIFNSSLILLNVFLYQKTASLIVDGNILRSTHRRSLVTLIAHYRPLTERRLVTVVSIIVAFFTALGVLVWVA